MKELLTRQQAQHLSEILEQMGYIKVIKCRDCKYWNRKDGAFQDFDGKEIHSCRFMKDYMHGWDHCSLAEKKEESI